MLNHNSTVQSDSSLVDLDVHSRSQGYRKLELVQSFCCKVDEVTQMFVMVDYRREMTVKKSCKYGKYGSFGRLLFSLISYWLVWLVDWLLSTDLGQIWQSICCLSNH